MEGTCSKYELPLLEKIAAVLHHGGFETIGDTYSQLLHWISANGFRPAVGVLVVLGAASLSMWFLVKA